MAFDEPARQQFIEMIKETNATGRIFFRPILMQFAAKQVGASYRDFYLDHEVLVDANITCMETYGTDAIGLISDPMREAEAYGAVCEHPEKMGPHSPEPLIKTLEDIEALQDPDIATSVRMQDRIEGAKLYRERLGDDVPLIGWIEGPLAEACDLVGVSEMMLRLGRDPEFAQLLLDKMVPTAKTFAEAQIDAGCNIIGMGDAVCSQISADMYRTFVKDRHREIIDFIHSKGALVKLHICGNTTHILPDVHDVDPDIVDLDWMVDMDKAYEVLGPNIVRGGNLDPVAVVLQGSADLVREKTRELVAKERGRPFILSAGCEISPLTPPENLMAMREGSTTPNE